MGVHGSEPGEVAPEVRARSASVTAGPGLNGRTPHPGGGGWWVSGTVMPSAMPGLRSLDVCDPCRWRADGAACAPTAT